MLNTAQILSAARHDDGQRVAVRSGDLALTVEALDDLAQQCQRLFTAHGVGRGDRVALVLPNVPHFIAAYYGALRAGASVVPLSPLMTASELTYIFNDCQPTAVVSWVGFHEATAQAARKCGVNTVFTAAPQGAAPTGMPDLFEAAAQAQGDATLVPTDSSDVAVIIYTSGTTGAPKGAALTHDNLVWNARLFAERVEMRRGDVTFAALPFFHSFGQSCIMNTSLHSGAEMVLQARFDAPQALDLVEKHGITVLMGVPSMQAALLAENRARPRDTSSLRWMASGGSGLAAGLEAELAEEFGVPILQGYGLSETSPITHVCSPSTPRSGSVGQPIWGIEQRLVDTDGRVLSVDEIGEVQVRGHAVMAGYYGRPEVTAAVIDADGWFSTGDLGTIDDDGYLRIVDRKKDLIIRNGHNVYPSDIEMVLSQHPSVSLSAVVGLPNETVGEEVAAVVMLKPGAMATTEELSAYVQERVARNSYPRVIDIVDELPLGPTGKVLKRSIDLSALTERPKAASSVEPVG